MARTTTTLVNGVTISANTASDIAYSPAATALQAGTQSCVVHGKVKIAGAPTAYLMSGVRVYYKCIPYDSTDGIRDQCIRDAGWIDLFFSSKAGQYAVTSSKPFPATGGYVHTWVEIPKLPYDVVLTVTLVETDVSLVTN